MNNNLNDNRIIERVVKPIPIGEEPKVLEKKDVKQKEDRSVLFYLLFILILVMLSCFIVLYVLPRI